MNKKIYIIVKYIIFLAIFLHICLTGSYNFLVKTGLFLLTLILIVNDYFRRTRLFTSYKIVYFLSILFTILGAIVLRNFLIGPETVAYLFFILIEITRLKGLELFLLLFIHCSIFSTLLFLDMGIPNNFEEFTSVCGILLSYCSIAYTSYSINAIRREKERVNILNEDLKNKNIKLQQYALHIEELTITKERSHLAQELHDSVGHSLMALAMHLEFAKKICDTKQEKVKDIIIKSENITKTCISDLRQCFELLNEEREIECFYEAIEDIFSNFSTFNNLKFIYKAAENLDSLSPVIKNSLYKNIKESITNSIKHGKASEIKINIIREKIFVILTIEDNGVGCTEIVKSNGLIGIENRTSSLKGNVDYFTSDNGGFGVKISIPLLWGDNRNDKSCIS